MPNHTVPLSPKIHNITLVLSFHLLSVFAGANLITSLRQHDVLLAGFVLLTELVAAGVGLLILERMNPQPVYLWPPPERDYAIPESQRNHPCFKLLGALQALISYPSQANKSEVRRLLRQCEERSPKDGMNETARTVLSTYSDDNGG